MTNVDTFVIAPAQPDKPWSERHPANKSTYLYELLQAASNIVHDMPTEHVARTGLTALLDVLEERAKDLADDLDKPIFQDHWPQLVEALTKDRTLGLAQR